MKETREMRQRRISSNIRLFSSAYESASKRGAKHLAKLAYERMRASKEELKNITERND